MKIEIGIDERGYFFRGIEPKFYNKRLKRFESMLKTKDPISNFYMTESEVCDVLNKYYWDPIIIGEEVVSEHIKRVVANGYSDEFILNGPL